MAKYSLPCIISLLVGALYNIVDQIFIANASYLGSAGNAANTVVFPMTVVALALAVLVGDGACAYSSRMLGEGNQERAARTITTSIILMVLIGVALTLLYLAFSNPLIVFFGGGVNAETFERAKEYFFWITLGLPFYVFGQGINPVIRSDGSPKFAMASTLLGAILNIILDPIFIFPLHMGMAGAAIATVIGQIATAALGVWYLFHLKSVKIGKRHFKVSTYEMRKFLPLGLASLLSQISLVASMAAVNNMISKYSALDPVFSDPSLSQIPLAVVGIVMKFFQIIISISVGMAAGCIPVMGYNLGSGLKGRARSLFTKLLIAEAVLGLVALFIVEVFPSSLIGIFGAANESVHYKSFAIRCFRIYLSLTVLATVNKGTFISLQALGKAFSSTLISVLREIVFGVGFAILLPIWFGLDGVLFSMPLSDLLTFLIAFAFIAITYKELRD